MKKSLFIFVLISAMIAHAVAQSNNKINYQTVVRNASGAATTNQKTAFRLTLLNGSGGSLLYQERDTVTTNSFGLATLQIGGGELLGGDYNTIDWANVNAWLQVDLDPLGGTNYVTMGESQLMSVPYSLTSLSSKDNEWTSSGNDISNINSGNVGIGVSYTPVQKLEVNGGIRIGDASATYTGSMRYHNDDFEGFTSNGWQSLTSVSYQTFTGYNLTSTARNTLVYSPDSMIVNETGYYLILLNVNGSNGNAYSTPLTDYDLSSTASVYRTSTGGISQSIAFFTPYNDLGYGASFEKYLPLNNTTTNVYYLVANDVLKVSAYVAAAGSPTGSWGLGLYSIQIFKLR